MGTITNSGSIQQNSGGNNTDLILGGASVTLTGGGTITMDNNTNNRIYGAAGTDVLTNVNNTIQGSGQIGAGQMGLVNQRGNHRCQSAQRADHPDEQRHDQHRHAGGDGRRQSDSAGGDTYTNTSGTILASGTGSAVTLTGTGPINGGTLNTASGGVIEDTSGNPTLSGVTNKGTYQLPNDEDTQLVGTITNTGTMQLNSAGNATELQANGAVNADGRRHHRHCPTTSNNYLLQASGAVR